MLFALLLNSLRLGCFQYSQVVPFYFALHVFVFISLIFGRSEFMLKLLPENS